MSASARDANATTAEVEREGVQTFCDCPTQERFDCIETKLGTLDRARSPLMRRFGVPQCFTPRQSAMMLVLALVGAIAHRSVRPRVFARARCHRAPPNRLADSQSRGNTHHDRLSSCREAAGDTSEPITADHLSAVIGSEATDDAEVLVIAPALHKSALRFWLSDADAAIARAQTLQQESVEQLDDDGITGDGRYRRVRADESNRRLAGDFSRRIASRSSSIPSRSSPTARNITAAEITERFGLPVTVREIEH